MQNSHFKLFEHKCVLEVCVHIHPIMIQIHPVFFLPILKSLSQIRLFLSGEMRSRTQMQRNLGSLITKLNKRTKTTPKGKNKQAGRQKTGAQSNM